MEKRSYLKGQSFKVILKGGSGDAGGKYSGCSQVTPQDLPCTLATPFYVPVAPLDAWHRPSAVVSASCCVQSMKECQELERLDGQGRVRLGPSISSPTRMQVGCFLLKRMPTPIRQDSQYL